MKRAVRIPAAVAARWLAATALVVLVLALAGCEDWVALVADDVEEAYNLDIREPGQVTAAALGSQKLGDQDKADGLDVYRALRRVEYEEKGDRLLLLDKKYAGARRNYEEALKWTPGGDVGVVGNLVGGIADALLGNADKGPQDQGTPAQREKRADICSRIGSTYRHEAEATTDVDRQMELFRGEARARAESGSLRSDREDAALDYALAAFAANQGGDRTAACTYAAQAVAKGDGDMRSTAKYWGCP